jgi:hypothetical protein
MNLEDNIDIIFNEAESNALGENNYDLLELIESTKVELLNLIAQKNELF